MSEIVSNPDDGDTEPVLSNSESLSAATADDLSSIVTPSIDETAGTASAPYGYRADGQPRKKPGRPSKNGTAQAPHKATIPRTKQQDKAVTVSSAELARATFALFARITSAAIGPEWEPQSMEEADGMRAALTAYIESKGDRDIPPGLMLAFVFAGYSASRLEHDNTRRKLFGGMKGFSGMIKNAYKRLFSR